MPTQSFKLIHRLFLASGEETDLGSVTLNGSRLSIKLTLAGQTWFENQPDAWLREVRKVVRRLAHRNFGNYAIWDESSGLGLQRRDS